MQNPNSIGCSCNLLVQQWNSIFFFKRRSFIVFPAILPLLRSKVKVDLFYRNITIVEVSNLNTHIWMSLMGCKPSFIVKSYVVISTLYTIHIKKIKIKFNVGILVQLSAWQNIYQCNAYHKRSTEVCSTMELK